MQWTAPSAGVRFKDSLDCCQIHLRMQLLVRTTTFCPKYHEFRIQWKTSHVFLFFVTSISLIIF